MQINLLLLRFVMLFSGLYRRFGIDPAQLEIILRTKLLMDDRRPFAFAGRRQKQKKDPKNMSATAIFVLIMMGAFLCFFLWLGRASIIGNALYIAAFMLVIAISLVSDFTSVLIDVRDNLIILPRPVNDRTFTASRVLHIAIHVFKMMLALSLGGMVCAGVIFGPLASLIIFLEIVLATVFSIFIVNVLYLAVLKFSTPAKFNNIISYVQIVFSVIIFATYQLLPRLMNRMETFDIDPLTRPWTYVMPPVWLASFFEVIVHPANVTMLMIALAVLGLLSPFAAVVYVVKVLAPGFNKKLSSISANGEEVAAKPVEKAGDGKMRENFAVRMSRVFCKNNVEQAGFRLSWWLTSRYRDFKLKTYPSFAYVPVIFIYMAFLGPGSRKNERPWSIQALRESHSYLYLAYFSVFILLAVLQQISQSEKYKAAWVMFTSAHNEPGKLLSGMFKAMVIKYYMPYYLVLSVFSVVVWGPAVLNDLVFALFNCLIYGVGIALFMIDYLPFSQPVTGAQGGRFFVRLFVMMFIGLFGLVHLGITRWEWAVDIGALCSAGIFWLIFWYFKKRDWKALEADYS